MNSFPIIKTTSIPINVGLGVLSPTLSLPPAEPKNLFQTVVLAPQSVYQIPIQRHSAEYVRVPTFAQTCPQPHRAPALKDRSRENRQDLAQRAPERAEPARERAQPPPHPVSTQEIIKEVGRASFSRCNKLI